jgi:hypothetical protein
MAKKAMAQERHAAGESQNGKADGKRRDRWIDPRFQG